MGKLLKNCVIARSGVYQYLDKELPALGLNINDAPEKKESYNVYRPSVILQQYIDKFSRLPLVIGHPREKVNEYNFRKYAVGYTSDRASIDYNKDTKEAVIKTSTTIDDIEAIQNYNRGIVELSPGYDAKFKFQSGTSPNNEKYDIIMVSTIQKIISYTLVVRFIV